MESDQKFYFKLQSYRKFAKVSWFGGWFDSVVRLKLYQPSLVGVGAWAELANNVLKIVKK